MPPLQRLFRSCAAPALLLAFCALAPRAQALEVYSLLNRACEIQTGLIINVDAEQVYLLDVQGELAVLPRANVNRILVFNTLDNPIPRLRFGGPLGALTREVYLTGADQPSYLGWPIRFQENAIIFFDIAGNTHVEDVERVELVRLARDVPAERTLPEAVPRTFVAGTNLPDCADSRSGEGPRIYPTRIISDQIKISRFLAAYDAGFEELERFRLRSAFYARPFQYEKETRFALTLSDFPNFESQELPRLLPFYFQWSSGLSYASQGLIVLGSKPVEWLPNVEPVFALRSEVKSSFFSASFVGSASGLSVGQDFIVENRFAYGDFFSRFNSTDLFVFPLLNHLALIGFDWGPYSAAIGYYYPIVGIVAQDVFREVVSTAPTSAYRLLRTSKTTRLRAIYAHTALGSDEPTAKDLRIVTADDMRNPSIIGPDSRALQDDLQSFRLDSSFIRLGFDVALRPELELGVDQVRFWGDYREAYPERTFALRYQHWITSLHAYQRFGNYVALRGYLNYFDRAYQADADGDVRDARARAFSLTVAIEFLL